MRNNTSYLFSSITTIITVSPFDSKLLKACTDGVKVGDFALHWLHNCDYLSYDCQSFISKLLHALVSIVVLVRESNSLGCDCAAFQLL